MSVRLGIDVRKGHRHLPANLMLSAGLLGLYRSVLSDHNDQQECNRHSTVTLLARFLGLWLRPGLQPLTSLREVSLRRKPRTLSRVRAGRFVLGQKKVVNASPANSRAARLRADRALCGKS
jgi:hypothetical protein